MPDNSPLLRMFSKDGSKFLTLKYGNDRINGGSSNQPYIRKEIPQSIEDLGKGSGPDFILRGGTLTPGRAIEDVSRLSKMFTDFRSIQGPLFTPKQNVLSRTNVKVAPSLDSNSPLNGGIYLPTSTLAGAAGGAFGINPNKQGINPFNIDTLSEVFGGGSYSKIIKGKSNIKSLYDEVIDKNTFALNRKNKSNSELFKYSGGPGSILGVGNTIIKKYSDFTRGDIFYNLYENPLNDENLNKSNAVLISGSRGTNLIEQLYASGSLDNGERELFKYFQDSSEGGEQIEILKYADFNKGKDGDGIEFKSGKNKIINRQTLTNDQIKELSDESKDNPDFINDYRTEIPNSTIIPSSLDYRDPKQRLEGRVNFGEGPGKKGNLNSYVEGKKDAAGNVIGPSDKINAMPLYRSNDVTLENIKNDLVKFRIGVIDNNTPSKKTYMHFRAFIDSMSEGWTSNWNSFNFMGRGENYYKYNGFERSVSLDWTVAAQSKQELIPMYQKLNYLSSVCTPDYSTSGYMRGNLVTLTVGGWFYEQVGIITGFNYQVPNDSPWEISIGDVNRTDINTETTANRIIRSDDSVKEMPMIINVTGFQFIPIHDFVPRRQLNSYNNSKNGINDTVSAFGRQRYIALKNGYNNNYQGTNNRNYTSDTIKD